MYITTCTGLPKANFYHGRGEFVLKLDSGHIVRYCEIKGVVNGIKKGSHVTEGDKIAEVGKMFYDSMLHFEMYKGNLDGPLTIRSNPKYQRRDDLMDPSGYLDLCILRSKRAW